MADESKAAAKTCRILTCRESTGHRVFFCEKHNEAWNSSGERRRLAAAFMETKEFVGPLLPTGMPPRLARAVMDFIDRTEAEDRNGTPNGK